MSKKMQVVQFRADAGVYRRAQERSDECGVKFNDAMRAALYAVAEGDVSQLSGLICSSESGEGEVNREWLYRRCHDLFEYKEGKLIRKYGSGRPSAEGLVATRNRGGEDCILMHGKHYPIKDIIWLMHYSIISGEVAYKNPARINDKHTIENLYLIPIEKKEVFIKEKLKRSDKIAFVAGKLRALFINTSGDAETTKAIDQLINNGETIPIILEGDDNWAAYRTAIHASKINDGQYVISMS